VVMEYGTKGRPDSARAVEATEPVEAYENTVDKSDTNRTTTITRALSPPVPNSQQGTTAV
jgi:hypothetical protein